MSRIILAGPAASGKDFLKAKLISRGYKPEVSYTTRPPRDGEVNGRSYHFTTDEDFLYLKEEGFFYEHIQFNGWYYGTSREQWEKCDLFIMTPSGVSMINPEDRKDCLIIYLDIPITVRMDRLLKRSDADSVERRLKADDKDFEGFADYDLRITNPDF